MGRPQPKFRVVDALPTKSRGPITNPLFDEAITFAKAATGRWVLVDTVPSTSKSRPQVWRSAMKTRGHADDIVVSARTVDGKLTVYIRYDPT